FEVLQIEEGDQADENKEFKLSKVPDMNENNDKGNDRGKYTLTPIRYGNKQPDTSSQGQ
ncbi:hypothetical protein HAX54_033201, partial [Datura stramonium]|nr:hypothetical protein [Datura stramonium]